MKKNPGLAAALVALLALLLGAGPAQAYPDHTWQVDAPTAVTAGTSFGIHAHPAQGCHHWQVSSGDQTTTGTGGDISATLVAPTVSGTHDVQVSVSCDGQTQVVSVAVHGAAVAAPLQTSGNTVLPNTGGPRAAIGVGGVVLLALGAMFLLLGRRRRTRV